MTVPRSRWASLERDPGNGHEPVEVGAPDIHAVPSPFDAAVHPGFGGTFVTDDAVLEGSLEFQGRRLVMWGGGNPLLIWNPGECLLERLTANRFVLSADGETITFTADDPEGLEAAEHFHHYGPARTTPKATPDPAIDLSLDSTVESDNTFELRALEPEPVNLQPAARTPAYPEAASREPVYPQPTFRQPVYPVEPEDDEPEHGSYVDEPTEPEPLVTEPEPLVTELEPEPPAAGEPAPTRRPYIKVVRANEETETLDVAEDLSSYEDDATDSTPADLAISGARRFTTVKAARWWTSDVQAAAIKVALVSGVVVVVMGFAFGIMLLLGGGSAPPATAVAPTTSIVTVPTSSIPTVATPSTAPLTTSVFELSASDFVGRWNALAMGLDETLVLSPTLTTPFSVALNPYITFDGVLDQTDGNLRLRAAPTGTAEGDRAIFAALALVIGTSEPSFTPANRGQLLEALGLDPRNPVLADLDGARTFNGRLYELVYLTDERILQFTVRPDDPTATTTTGG